MATVHASFLDPPDSSSAALALALALGHHAGADLAIHSPAVDPSPGLALPLCRSCAAALVPAVAAAEAGIDVWPGDELRARGYPPQKPSSRPIV